MAKPQQHINIFTEETWKKHHKEFPDVSPFFSGKKGETFVIADQKAHQFLIGLGNDLSEANIVSVLQKFSFDFKDKLATEKTSLNTKGFSDSEVEKCLLGLYLGTYHYPFSDTHPFWNKKFTWENIADLDQKFANIKAICEGQFACMDWLNKPANYKKVTEISAFIEQKAKEHNLKYTVYNRAECEKLGLGAFVAVNQGSSQDAAFTILEYKSPKKNAPKIGLVGKCVLFDTGGISIKGSANMHYMKSDLGGATAVLGALLAASKMQLPVDITAILPITDNAVSNTAYLPSDVVTAYNGKTIEVLDTDAEGRMTLADGLSYLTKNYKVDCVVDLATLTGSAVRMFGTTCGALFNNNEKLQHALEKSGNETGQRLWNMPLWAVWDNDITSDVADFKNISLKPYGDCIVAATFLKNFINDHPKWAHLDIAAMCFDNVFYAKEKAATGYGVRLLIDFMQNYKN